MCNLRAARTAFAAVLVLLVASASAGAADRVKVVTKTATIRAQANVAAKALLVVGAGTVLDVVRRGSTWHEVSVPAGTNRAVRTGFIEVNAVVPTTERAVLVPLGPGGPGQPAVRTAARRPGTRLRVFGEAAYQAFSAKDSFEAILDSPNGLFYGGGVDVTFGRNLFASVGVSRFGKTGQRAFAHEGESYGLGVPAEVTVTPIMLNVGVRFPGRSKLTPYVGIGAGAIKYHETSEGAAAGENISKTATAFQVMGGVEVSIARSVALALEGQYQTAGGVLGKSGVSEVFKEKDLGGTSVRVKLLFGM